MTLHPLTPRKSETSARIAAATTTILVSVLLFVVLVQLVPPVAWIAHLDRPARADPEFLSWMLSEFVSEAIRSSDPAGSLLRLVFVPIKITKTLAAFGVAQSLAFKAAASLIVGYLAGLKVWRTIMADKIAQPAVSHVSGPRLLAGSAARSSLKRVWAERFGTNAQGIEIATGVVMPDALADEHILLAGGTGAGKTTIMEKLMDGAIVRGDRLFALDVKGDVTARFPTNRFKLLSLDDARSAKWLPGRDIVTEEDAFELAIEMIRETSDPSWSGGARQVLAALIQLLQHETLKNRKYWDWETLSDLLSKPLGELHDLIKGIDPSAAGLINTTVEENRRQAQSFQIVLSCNATHVARAFAAMGRNSKTSFSVRAWASGKGSRNLIVQQSQRTPELSAAMCRLTLKIMADALVSQKNQNQSSTWLFLDELPQIGRCDAIPRLAAIGRSMRIRLVAAIQSPAQLQETYGDKGAQHLLDNLTTKIIGRVAGGKTAGDVASTWIGKRTVSWHEETGREQDGRPRTDRKTQDILVVDPLFLSNELGLSRRSNGDRVIRAIVIGHGDVALLTWPVGQWTAQRPANIPKARR